MCLLERTGHPHVPDRSAILGSTREARRASRYVANMATVVRTRRDGRVCDGFCRAEAHRDEAVVDLPLARGDSLPNRPKGRSRPNSSVDMPRAKYVDAPVRRAAGHPIAVVGESARTVRQIPQRIWKQRDGPCLFTLPRRRRSTLRGFVTRSNEQRPSSSREPRGRMTLRMEDSPDHKVTARSDALAVPRDTPGAWRWRRRSS